MNMKRMRGRNHRPNGGGGGGGGFRNQQNGIPLNRNHVFDSSGPEMRVRGTAQQLFEKYQQLARDASSNGDRVLGEAYYQHAEHYFRIISAINQAQGQPQPHQQGGQPNGQGGQQAGAQPAGGQPAGGQPYPNGNQHGGDRGPYQGGDYNRRAEPTNGDAGSDQQPEFRGENRYEPRQQDSRGENRNDNRSENRNENRQQDQRRFENRPYEPRNKPDYQPRQDRQDRPDRQDREPRYRPDTQIPAAPIDISSALEAELAAAAMNEPTAEPLRQPEPVIEARAIPIIPDAPPPAAPELKAAPEPAPKAAPKAAPEAAAEAPAMRTPRPRGRPRTPKPEAAELKLETPETE